MLDIKFVRENPEVVKQNIRNKFQDNKLELVLSHTLHVPHYLFANSHCFQCFLP